MNSIPLWVSAAQLEERAGNLAKARALLEQVRVWMEGGRTPRGEGLPGGPQVATPPGLLRPWASLPALGGAAGPQVAPKPQGYCPGASLMTFAGRAGSRTPRTTSCGWRRCAWSGAPATKRRPTRRWPRRCRCGPRARACRMRAFSDATRSPLTGAWRAHLSPAGLPDQRPAALRVDPHGGAARAKEQVFRRAQEERRRPLHPRHRRRPVLAQPQGRERERVVQEVRRAQQL